VIASEIITPCGNTIEVVDEKIGFDVIIGWLWMLSHLDGSIENKKHVIQQGYW